MPSGESYGEVKSFEDHFEDLRASIKHTGFIFAALTAFFFILSGEILALMQQDLAVSLHGLSPFEVLNVRIGMAFIFGIIFSSPVIIYSIVQFARPGLKNSEYKVLRNFLPFSYLLFVSGTVFAYQFIFKNAVNFFINYTQASGVTAVWGLQNTLMLGLRISLVTGFLFQLPLLVLILHKSGLVTLEQLKEYRPYVVVGILLIAAVATPPDIITQVGITLPIILLYELSIRIAKHV